MRASTRIKGRLKDDERRLEQSELDTASHGPVDVFEDLLSPEWMITNKHYSSYNELMEARRQAQGNARSLRIIDCPSCGKIVPARQSHRLSVPPHASFWEACRGWSTNTVSIKGQPLRSTMKNMAQRKVYRK